MVNTGNGENENASTQSPSMVEPSTPSVQSGRRSTRGTRSSITPAEALELLTSALAYCNDAHIEAAGYYDPENGGVVLFVPGADLVDGRIVLAR